MLYIKAVLFTLFIPCVVAVVIPYLLSLWWGSSLELEEGKIFGLPFLILGLVLYFASAGAFVVQGGGTPTMWFAEKLGFLIGKEPGVLVRSSVYRWTRNPLYLAVVIIVLGQALLFDDFSYHLYGLFLWAVFHNVVRFLEEPHLKKKYGKAYEEYCSRTPRWIGRPAEEAPLTSNEKEKR